MKGVKVMKSCLKEWVSEWNAGALLADGFEDAIVGVCERFGALPVVAYDRGKCIEILVERDGMDYEEAVEYFEFNMLNMEEAGSGASA